MSSEESNFGPKKQTVILFGSVSLFFVYKLKLFQNPDYNKLALIFSIICFLWFISVFVRWLFYSDQRKDILDELPKIELPYGFKCLFRTRKCEDGDLNVWSLIHFIIYIVVGYFVPGHYLAILIISILCELVESEIGDTNKMILDPITNLVGYYIGSQISPRRGNLC
jgi:hypothetical protein